jgi:hypothetical protein
MSMRPVGGGGVQTARGGHEPQWPDWLDGIDPSEVPPKVLRRIEHLDPDKDRSSKTALRWLIGAHLTGGRTNALIATIKRFNVAIVGVRLGTEQGFETLMAAVKACKTLRGLSLVEARLSDDEAHELASSLANNGHVSSLELKSCTMSRKAWRAIADRLPDMYGLKRLKIKAKAGTKAGKCLTAVVRGIAGSSSLTTLELSLSQLTPEDAAKFGKALQGNRSLTRLVFEVEAECAVVESFMEALVEPAEHLEDDPLPRLAKLSLVAHPFRPLEGESGEVWFSSAFRDLLIRQIEARSELGSVRIAPGIGVDAGAADALEEALRKHSVEFDIGVRQASRPWLRIDLDHRLSRHLALRKYQSLVASSAAQKAAAKALLSSIPVLGGSLPQDITDQILPRMMGGDSLRQRWARRGWMQVNRAAYEAAVEVRSKEAVDSLVTPEGGVRDRVFVMDDFMRLELSGIRLRDRDRARLSNAFSPRIGNNFARKTGKELVRKHMELAEHLLAHHNRDGALVALEALQRVAKAYHFKEPRGLGILKMRIALKR